MKPTYTHTRRPTAVPSAVPTASEQGSSSSDWTEDPNSFVIGASVGGAVCFGLCGLYVLYRRTKHKKKKESAEKVPMAAVASTVDTVVDTSAGSPALQAVISTAAEVRVREPERYSFHTPAAQPYQPRSRNVSFVSQTSFNNFLQVGSRSRGVSFASDTSFANETRSRFVSFASISSFSTTQPGESRSRAASFVSNTSYNISSLHSSERSFDQYIEFGSNLHQQDGENVYSSIMDSCRERSDSEQSSDASLSSESCNTNSSEQDLHYVDIHFTEQG